MTNDVQRRDDDEVPDGLVKVTVYLRHSAYDAMLYGASVTNDTRSEVINRALELYATLAGYTSVGLRIFIGRWRLFPRRVRVKRFEESTPASGG